MPGPEALVSVERDTLQGQIYRQLRDRLMSGFFRPGHPMSTRSIAAAVGASAMPVRDALRRLEAENALVPGPNRTLMVPHMTGADLAEIRDIRLALEGMAAERAAAAIRAVDIECLSAFCRDMDGAIDAGDIEGYLRTNWAFHSRIYHARGTTLLTMMIESLWARMGPYIRFAMVDLSHLNMAMEAHWAIVAALERQDGAAARKGIELDIRGAAKDLAVRLALDLDLDAKSDLDASSDLDAGRAAQMGPPSG